MNGRASHSAQDGIDCATQVATSTSSSLNCPALTTSAATAAYTTSAAPRMKRSSRLGGVEPRQARRVPADEPPDTRFPTRP